MDLLNWFVERVGQEELESAGWKVESISDTAIKVVDARNGQPVFEFGDHLNNEAGELIEIGKNLSVIRDMDQLLDLILAKARSLAGADAGSIYVLEGESEQMEDNQLRFKLSQNDSLSYASEEFVLPVSKNSIAGAAVLTKKTINIPDVQDISEEAPYHYDSTWDERTGYDSRSILAVPMLNHNNAALGVIQLINKKRNPADPLRTEADFEQNVIPVDKHSQELVETLASQAGIAMENAALYTEIERIFNGFAHASVHAIEQRDPATSGHSLRVASLTRRLAEEVSQITEGPYADIGYTEKELKEIETAALLHDFGKVAVRESVFAKAKKLTPPNLKMIRSRFDFIKSSIENDHLHRRLVMVEDGAPKEELAILDQASTRAVSEIDECWRIIRSANEPTVLPSKDIAKIEHIANRSYFDLGGSRQPFLEPDEVEALQITKGSVTEEEMAEIRSHVTHTISFLKEIPWGASMRNIPAYAGSHHEKLNGNGYPYGLKDEDIPLPGKMMAVADIYDALTAADRPYKKAVSVERALYILDLETKDNHIDPELVRLFKENHVYKAMESD
jgi:HD-GYP domain-containing protein (c-di-GMP phosphodiesterase class II)